MRDPALGTVGNAGRNHPAIAVADQHDVAQILALQNAEHIGDMRVEIDIGRRKMRALAKPGIARRENVVASGAQQRTHFLPRPCRRPCAMRNDDCGHTSPRTSADAASSRSSLQRLRMRFRHCRANCNHTIRHLRLATLHRHVAWHIAAGGLRRKKKASRKRPQCPARTRPPFRADHVGSLLRPASVAEGARTTRPRCDHRHRNCARIEDEAVREVVRRQEDIGLQAVTDGEFRRIDWFMDFKYAIGGIEKLTEKVKVPFRSTHRRARFRVRRLSRARPHAARRHDLRRGFRLPQIVSRPRRCRSSPSPRLR